MEDMTEEEIAERLRGLPPAPEAWVRAASELPRARELMDGIVARAEADAEYRRTVLADLEAALRLEGVEPATPLLDELRRQLDAEAVARADAGERARSLRAPALRRASRGRQILTRRRPADIGRARRAYRRARRPLDGGWAGGGPPAYSTSLWSTASGDRAAGATPGGWRAPLPRNHGPGERCRRRSPQARRSRAPARTVPRGQMSPSSRTHAGLSRNT